MCSAVSNSLPHLLSPDSIEIWLHGYILSIVLKKRFISIKHTRQLNAYDLTLDKSSSLVYE